LKKKKIILSIYQCRLREDLAMKKSKEFGNDEVFLSWSFCNIQMPVWGMSLAECTTINRLVWEDNTSRFVSTFSSFLVDLTPLTLNSKFFNFIQNFIFFKQPT
jgi:hypothetical protein